MDFEKKKEYYFSLYEKHVDMVYRICYFYLGNSHDAEDAVQNIFYKIIKKELSFKDSEHEKAFLIVCAKNYCKDIVKSFWIKKRVDYDEIVNLASNSEKEIDLDLTYEIMNLPSKYKLPLYLYYYEGYSVKEISHILEEKETTIQTHLSRARKKLKLQIESEGYYNEKRPKGAV